MLSVGAAAAAASAPAGGAVAGCFRFGMSLSQTTSGHVSQHLMPQGRSELLLVCIVPVRLSCAEAAKSPVCDGLQVQVQVEGTSVPPACTCTTVAASTYILAVRACAQNIKAPQQLWLKSTAYVGVIFLT